MAAVDVAPTPKKSKLSKTPSAEHTSGGTSALHKKERRVGLAFIAVPVIGFVLFTVYPFLYSILASFTHWNGISPMRFAGFDNYTRMIQDPYFHKAMYNTVFLMIGIPIGLVLSLLLALAMNRKMRGLGLFRTLYYIPVVSSLAAIAIMWQWAYNGDFGLINQVLELFGIDGPNWLQDTATVKPAIMIMSIWKGLGYSMLLYLAAIQSVPASLYEAASIDGANAFQKFKAITIPMVKPVTFFLVVTSIIGGAQVFIEVNIMTPDGGPEFSSATIVWYIWRQAFNYGEMGYASALAIALGLLVFIVTAIQFRLNARNNFSIE
jgi:multiple sugar transport system permease protein